MQYRPVLLVTGLFLLVLAALMLVPTVVSLVYDEAVWREFLYSSAICFVTGLLLFLFNRMRGFRLWPRQAFLLTTVAWFTVSAFAALPLLFIEQIDYADAFFETMSGITTTGSTVLSDLEHHTRAVLFWRSLLQWLGGIGFVAMGIAILPFLRVGGMRLFRSESSDWSEKATPRFGSFARTIVFVYLLLTLCNATLYWLVGMSAFDAINHAMSTISTGGYSTYDASLGHFHSYAVLWVGIVFMLLGAMPFALYVHVLHRRVDPLIRDQQVRAFLKLIVLVSLGLTLWLSWKTYPLGAGELLTHVTFNVVSVVTTTGFVSQDYAQWGTVAHFVFFYLMFVGGCSGSTSGSIKVFRYQVAYAMLKYQLARLVHPNAVITLRYNRREVSDDIIWSLVAFSFFFGLTIAILAGILAAFGLDLVTSLTGAITAVTNVGPGLGEIIGPSGNFATIPDPAKWALSIGMLLGRLEIMTVLVLFTPAFWRG